MPFDELKRRALDALGPRRQAYDDAVATAVDEVQVILEAARPRGNGKGERLAAELGLFATGRIDIERFASVLADEAALAPDAVEGIDAALHALMALSAEDDDLYTFRLAAGSDLRDGVREALGHAGRAFGAARAVEALRTGAAPAPYATGFSPGRWNRAERAIAPPLVVELEGADLRPAGLADFLEGCQAIVLLVRKQAPPAALARLIVPGVLVAQGPDGDTLDELKRWDGPAIVAVAPESAARFTYRPEADGSGELRVHSLPEEAPRPVAGRGAARQRAEIQLLRMLETAAAGRVAAAAVPGPSADPDPADKLAAWLLRQATIPAPGAEG